MYAQRNYPQPLGTPPTKYTIAQIGCFLTAFANLRTRFGWGINPVALNAAFVQLNLYTDIGDGVKDALAWNAICVFDPRIELVATGGASAPPSNNAIVKFIYNGGLTHFCLVADSGRGLIVDSYDGQIKSWNVYGGVKAWATYKDNQGGEMPLTPQQQDKFLKMGLQREPTAEELNNQAYATNPGLLADTLWNNGGSDIYYNIFKPLPQDILNFMGAVYKLDTSQQKYIDEANALAPLGWKEAMYRLAAEYQDDVIAKPDVPAPTPEPTPTPDPTPTPTPTPPDNGDTPPSWFSNFWQKVADAILSALGRK